MADMNAEGFMQSVDSANKYGDINDQFYRADLEFDVGDNVTLRYAYDKSTQDRQGGARATWEIGPKNIFTLPNGQLFNTNPHAQAYENAFGILYDDFNVVSGFPGGLVGEYETRVAHATNGLYLDLDRQTFDAQWDITDKLRFHAIVGAASRTAASWWTSTPIRACSSPTARTTTRSSRIPTSCSSAARTATASSSTGSSATTPTNARRNRACRRSGHTVRRAICSVASTIRGVTRRRPGRVLQQPHAGAQPAEPVRRDAADDGGADPARKLWNQVDRARSQLPRRHAGRILERDGRARAPICSTSRYDETEAVFADLSWDVTEKLTLGFGMRTADGHAPRHRPDPPRGERTATTTNILEPFPWNDPDYNLRDPFGYSAINTPLAGASEFDGTPARLSVQYQFTDDVMAYVTLADGYQPGGTTTVPANILVLNAAGVATGRAAARCL